VVGNGLLGRRNVAARVESENEGRGKKEEVRKNEEEWGR
jgi:hypothetical protein